MTLTTYHPFRSPEAQAQFLTSYDDRAKRWPIPSETTIIETSYGSTFVRISGPAEGLPLVLLHGHSENSLNWLPNIEALSQSYHTYAIDTISDPGRSVYTKLLRNADDFTNWLNQLFDGLGLASGIHLIGLSYGGWIASQYALRFPQRLQKLMLMAPGGIAPYSLTFLLKGTLMTIFQFRVKFLFKRLTRWMFEDCIRINPNGEDVFNQWFEFIYLGINSHKQQPIVFTKILTDAELQQLQMPTLFLVGENEIIYSTQKATTRVRKAAPHIHIKVIQDAGHDLPFAQPDKVNHAILDFLNEEKQ